MTTSTRQRDDERIGLVTLDEAGRIEAMNPASADLLRTSSPALLGRAAHDVLHGAHGPAAACALTELLATPFGHRSALSTLSVGGVGAAIPVRFHLYPLGSARAVVVLQPTEVRRFGPTTLGDEGRVELRRIQQSVDDLQWLADLDHRLSSTLDEDSVLRHLADSVTARLASVAVVDRVTRAGSMHRVAIAHAAHSTADADAVSSTDPLVAGLSAPSGSVGAVRLAAVRRLRRADLDTGSGLTASSVTLLRRLDAADLIIVPLLSRGRVLGVLAAIRHPSDDPFTDADELLCRDIARRAAVNLDNARLYREQRDIAMDLQTALLPHTTAVRPGRSPVEIASRYVPAQGRCTVGGDWYDHFACPQDPGGRVLVIGDVAGHDLSAATRMAALRNLVRGITVATSSTCADILTVTDRNLERLGITGTATAIVAALHPTDGGDWTLRWSNAGHPPPVLITPAGRASVLDDHHGPLLGTGAAASRGCTSARIPTGSTLVLYTDGLVEHRDEAIGHGIERLRRAVERALPRSDSLEDFLDALHANVHPGSEDDIAVLAVRVGTSC